MYKYWVWAQSRLSKSSILMVTFWEAIFFKLLNNDDKKMWQKFYSKLISCLGTGWENKN